jgi:hypothetical protein
MKNLIFAAFVFLLSSSLYAQKQYNFYSMFGFNYYDLTGKNMKYEDVLKGENLGDGLFSDGFNHYTIDLNAKTFTHNYISLESGVADGKEVISKITNLVETDNFIKFDVSTEDFGKMSLVINKNIQTDVDLVVVFKEDKKTYAAVFIN